MGAGFPQNLCVFAIAPVHSVYAGEHVPEYPIQSRLSRYRLGRQQPRSHWTMVSERDSTVNANQSGLTNHLDALGPITGGATVGFST
jgi:hypothetical protein